MIYGFGDFDGNQNFNSKEESSILSTIRPSQLPIVCKVKTEVRYDGKVIKKCAIVLTKHFVYLFSQKQKDGPFEKFCEIHIDDIVSIGYNVECHKNGDIKQQNVHIMSTKHNIITNAPEVLKLAQMLNVFIQLSFPYSSNKRQQSKPKVTIACDDPSLFPDLSNIPISPSQRFQFAYLAKCARNNIQYNQEIVNYVHNLLISKNSLVDLSQLPADFALGSKDASDVIDVVFETLGELGYISGVCCANINNPSIFNALVRLLEVGTSFSIVHLENCNATSGMKAIFESRARSTPNFNVAYWNLKGNKLSDLNYLPSVLALNQRGLDCLNLSDTSLSHRNLIDLFAELSRNERLMSLRHLFLSGAPLNTAETVDAFSGWLSAAADLDLLRLETLDISGVPDSERSIDAVLKALMRRPPPLRALDVSRNRVGRRSQVCLCELARTSRTLRMLDISDTQLRSSDAYEIAECVASNRSIGEFVFKMSGLGVHGKSFLDMFQFMSSSKEKWVGFSLDRSGMDAEDAKTLGAFLGRMRSTSVISLDGNFDRSMGGVGLELPKLVRGKTCLKELSIAGDNSHRLGQEILPLLEELQGNRLIESLDISNNQAGDAALPYIAAIIRNCPNLRSLKMDGNGFTDARALQEVVDAIGANASIESCPFPVNDGKRAAERLKNQKDRDSFVDTLARMQMEAVKAVNCNRSAKKLPNELPFEVTPELHDLIDELSAECQRRTRGRRLMTHTLACELLGVPLPFQPRGVLVEPENVEEVDDSALDVYGEECLKRYTVEDKEAYPGVIFTTINPDIRSVINSLPPLPSPQPDPNSNQNPNTDSDSDSESNSDPEPIKEKRAKAKPKKVSRRKKVVFSDDSDTSDDFDIKSRKKQRNRKTKKKESTDDEYNEEFELRTRRLPAINDSDSDSSESSQRESGRARNAPRIRRIEIEDPDDLPAPIPRKPKSQRKPKFTHIDYSGSDAEIQFKPSPKPKSNPRIPNSNSKNKDLDTVDNIIKKPTIPPPTNDLITVQFNPIKPKPVKKAVVITSSSSESENDFASPNRQDDYNIRSHDDYSGFNHGPYHNEIQRKPKQHILAQRMDFEEDQPVITRTKPLSLNVLSSDSDSGFKLPPRPAPVRKHPTRQHRGYNDWGDF